MSGFSVDVADASTPASDCSPFSSTLIYNMHSQPGSSSMTGGQWDGAVEGSQNFTEYSNQGDIAQESEYAYKMEPQTQTQTQTQQAQTQTQTQQTQLPKWNGSSLGSSESIGSVPMRRSVSRSSAGSFQGHGIRSSSHKTRPRLHSALSSHSHSSHQAGAYASASAYGLAGYTDSSVAALPSYFPTSAGNPLGPSQHYLAGYPQGLGSPFAYGISAGLGAAYPPQYHPQHVDPACTQMGLDFDTSAPPSASSQAWNSASNSRHSSPDGGDDDIWQMPQMVSSPAESHGSTSSYMPHMDTDRSSNMGGSISSNMSSTTSDSGSTSGGRRLSHAHSQDDHLDEDFELSAAATALQQKRSNSESSDSARDHYLYKNVACGEDGLYHCPWEGKSNCSHKPEKLKCNYDKFVDSHLKPYRCKHTSCENARFSSTACLLRHEREAHAMHGHGDKPYLCPYPGCDRAQPGFGFPRQWNLKDHMRRVHRDDGSQQPQAQAQAQLAVSSAAAAVAAHIETLPVVPSSSSAVSKNRKRKKESPAVSAPSSRKSSTSRGSSSRAAASVLAAAAEAAQAQAEAAQIAQAQAQAQAQAEAQAQAQAQAQAAAEAFAAAQAEKARLQMEEWKQYRSALLDLVNAGLQSPHDPEVQDQLQLIQLQVDHLNSISAACFMAPDSASFMHFSQQSG